MKIAAAAVPPSQNGDTDPFNGYIILLFQKMSSSTRQKTCPTDKNHKNTEPRRAASHRDLYAPNRIFFPKYCNKIPRQASALPWNFILSCEKNLSFWSASQFWIEDFSSQQPPATAWILDVFQGRRGRFWRKRFIQNRVNPYVSPPNGEAFANQSAFA